LLDLLLTPRLLPAPLLHQKAQAWANYRFTKMRLEFVSYFPATAVGGICYGVTRDVDTDIADVLRFTKSCETSVTSSISAQRTSLVIDCSPNMNKQRYFSTMSEATSDFAQFRLLSVICQKVIGAEATDIAIEVYCHATVEFSGPVAPPFAGHKITGITSAGVIPYVGFNNALEIKRGTLDLKGPPVEVDEVIYMLNPSLRFVPEVQSGDTPVISAIRRTGGYWAAFPDVISAASGAYGGRTYNLTDLNYSLTSEVFAYPVVSVHHPGGVTSKMAAPATTQVVPTAQSNTWEQTLSGFMNMLTLASQSKTQTPSAPLVSVNTATNLVSNPQNVEIVDASDKSVAGGG